MTARIAARAPVADWARAAVELDAEGFAVVPGLLPASECAALVARCGDGALVEAEPGHGELRRVASAWAPLAVEATRVLPAPLHAVHDAIRAGLAALAQRWRDELGPHLDGEHGTATAAITRLRAGEDRPLRHGAGTSPLQVTLLLSEPGVDFTGGELVMTEQRPRMQSRPIVVAPRRGDAVVFATDRRPCQGVRGRYRVRLKHAVSRVLRGERVSVELVLRDAP